MAEETHTIRWAEKLRPDRLRRLYINDANGLTDDALVDDVGWTLYLRCESVLLVCAGSVKCPRCKAAFLCVRYHDKAPHQVFPCPECGWTTTEAEYTRSHRGQDLSGRGAMDAFQEFVDTYPKAHSYKECVLRIDRLIHAFHHDLKRGDHPHRAAAVNLIVGSPQQVIALLDGLTYSSGSGPEIQQTLVQWQDAIRDMRRRRS